MTKLSILISLKEIDNLKYPIFKKYVNFFDKIKIDL